MVPLSLQPPTTTGGDELGTMVERQFLGAAIQIHLIDVLLSCISSSFDFTMPSSSIL